MLWIGNNNVTKKWILHFNSKKIQTNSQTNTGIDYTNDTCLRTTPNDPRFPYLFHTNKKVEQNNMKILSMQPSKPIIINAIDENYGNTTMYKKKVYDNN